MSRRSTIPRAMILLPVLALVIPFVTAKSAFGEACSRDNTHLDQQTWSLVTDCDVLTYCHQNGTCAHRGCRSDLYPVGYNGVPFDKLPPLCPDGQFCPDESDQCLPTSPIGGQCQKDRDDECTPPSNYKELDGFLNVNGTICLNFTCQLANVTIGQTCIFDNTPYVGYNEQGTAYSFVVSRDNCANGLYCDGSSAQCLKSRQQGEACTGNKECLSYNCLGTNKCGRAADEPIHAESWVYALVGLGIIALIVGTFVSLWFMHRKWRTENQIKLEQYYNEQIAYRQSIMSMSHAKNSLLSLPVNTAPAEARRTLYVDDYDLAGHEGLLPPNMRRGDSAQWSETDSEVLLVPDHHHLRPDRDAPSPPPMDEGTRYRGDRF